MASNRKLVLATTLVMVALFFVFDDVFGLMNGGGIFSVASALSAAHRHMPRIAIDCAGLRTLFIMPCALAAGAVGAYLDIDLNRRWTSLLFMIATIASGYALDILFGEGIETALLARSGYSRCDSLDRARGSGKSKVWFNGYATTGACPAEAPT